MIAQITLWGLVLLYCLHAYLGDRKKRNGELSVLMIEDSDSHAMLYSKFLREKVAKCYIYRLDHAKITCLEEYNLVILDFFLGEATALPVFDELSKANIPIILLTSFDREQFDAFLEEKKFTMPSNFIFCQKGIGDLTKIIESEVLK